MLNKKRAFLYNNLLLAAAIFTVFGCANQQRPQGGPKDVTPPRLLKATPGNMSRHFNAKIVQLDFDKFIKLYNPFTEISMSPVQEKPPEYKLRKKSVIITFKDTLQKNTTYVINFGKAIQDVNEGNILKNFTYVFSTGSHIDSLSVSGNVTNTLTQLKEKDVTVMLFPLAKDSIYFGKKKPLIYTTTDTAGNFSLNNLAEGDYRIYALKETTPDRIYNKDDELIAFLKKPISLHTDTSDIHLNLFLQEPEKFRVIVNKFDIDGKWFLVFNKHLQNPSLKVIYPAALNDQKVVDFSRTNDTAYLYMKNMDFDSIRVAILDNNKPIDSVSKIKGRKESFIRNIAFSFNIGGTNKLKPTSDLEIKATSPIQSFDPSLITLTEDSTVVSNYTFTKDSADIRKFTLKYKWKEDSKYILNFDDGAFTNIYNEKSKRYIKKFQINKQENYSTLTLKVTVPDTSKAYVVEIYQDPRNVLNSYPITKNTSIVYKNYVTSKYRIRVIYDDNRNGKWDSGNVRKGLQPENIWIDPQEINLRPNWDAEEKLDIPREPVEP